MSNAITTLTFEDTDFAVIDWRGQTWLRGPQIGAALGYSGDAGKAIRTLYQRNSDEFSDRMTMVFTQESDGGPQETRMFSPRGAHLLAMLAKTERAKAFRAWVLDLIEGEQANLRQMQDWLEESHRQLLALDPRFARLRLFVERGVAVFIAAKLARMSAASAEVAVAQMYLCGMLRSEQAWLCARDVFGAKLALPAPEMRHG